MGIIENDTAISYLYTIRNVFKSSNSPCMTRGGLRGILKLAEARVLKLVGCADHIILGEWPVGEQKLAMGVAHKQPEAGKMVLLKPWMKSFVRPSATGILPSEWNR